MMADMLVPLDFVSTGRGLADLQRIAGCGPSGSVDRQSCGPGGRTFSQSRLRVSSTIEVLTSLSRSKRTARLHDLDRDGLQNDIRIYLDVALFASTAMVSVEIPTFSIDELPVRPVAIAISPCSDDQGELSPPVDT